MKIGDIVRSRRETLKLSQRDLERLTGRKVTQPKIARLETGDQANITIDTLRAIAKGFGCSVVDLLPDEDKIPQH